VAAREFEQGLAVVLAPEMKECRYGSGASREHVGRAFVGLEGDERLDDLKAAVNELLPADEFADARQRVADAGVAGVEADARLRGQFFEARERLAPPPTAVSRKSASPVTAYASARKSATPEVPE
jgi:hypothetical protein